MSTDRQIADRHGPDWGVHDQVQGVHGAYPSDHTWPAPADEPERVTWQDGYFRWIIPTIRDQALHWDPRGKPHPWPRLHTIDLVMNGTTPIDKHYSPEFADQLFRGDDVKLVDLTDREEIGRIRRLYQEYNRPPTRQDVGLLPPEFESDLQVAIDRFEDPHQGRRQFFDCAQNRIRCFYLRQHEGWVPLDRSLELNSFITYADDDLEQGTPKQGKPNMDIPWIREVLGKLRIRPVHAFVRANGRDPWEDAPVTLQDPQFGRPLDAGWDGRWQLPEPGN